MANVIMHDHSSDYMIDRCMLTLKVRVVALCVYCDETKVVDIEEPPPICPSCKDSTFMFPKTVNGYAGDWDHLIEICEDYP